VSLDSNGHKMQRQQSHSALSVAREAFIRPLSFDFTVIL
jgi:hypothetical protein